VTYREHDETVPVSDLMGDDYDATVAEINARSAAGENPFAHIPDNSRRSHRPTPYLVIGMTMLATWSITTLAAAWPAFGQIAPVVAMVTLWLMVAWAKSE
jgi:hypothetical protein